MARNIGSVRVTVKHKGAVSKRLFHVKQSLSAKLLADTEIAENDIQQVFYIHMARDPSEGTSGTA